MSVDENKAVDRRFATEVLDGHNVDALPDFVADDGIVAARSTWRGTHRGAFMGVEPMGRRVSVEAWTMDQFRDGKIARSRITMDTLGPRRQLGLVSGL